MQLVERHIITLTNKYYKELDEATFKSKNLYNSTVYAIRQHFFQTEKYLSYATLQKQFQDSKQPDYTVLPAKVAQQTMKQVDTNFRAFFKALKAYKSNPSKLYCSTKFIKLLINVFLRVALAVIVLKAVAVAVPTPLAPFSTPAFFAAAKTSIIFWLYICNYPLYLPETWQ